MDYTILPSFLQDGDNDNRFVVSDQAGRLELILGEVKDIIYPSDEGSVSKTVIEYNVWAQVRTNGSTEGILFYNCRLASYLGSIADKTTFVLRTNPKAGEESGEGFGNGAKVLLQCLNGESVYPIIVGGAFDPEDESQKDIPEDELFYQWVYNGVSIGINNDGEVTVTYGGKTDNDGETDVDDDVRGSYAKFAKNGNVVISDNDGKNSVTIDHENKKVVIARDKAFELGEATDKMLLGESFRKEHQKLNRKVQTVGQVMEQLTKQAAIAVNQAGGKMAVPVTGAVSAAADITQLGVYMQLMTQQWKNLMDAFKDFEQAASKKNSFLSKKNKAD